MTALDNSVSSISLSLLSVKDLMKRKSCLPIGECRLFTAKRLKIACNATVSSSKYAKKIPKNSHRTESKYSKHTALSTNRKLPAGRTNNILRSANSSSVDVNKTSVVNTDLQQRCAKAAVVNLCLDKNVALNSYDETTKSSTSSSHESGSSRQDDTPEVFGIRLDSKIQIESLNESDVCTVIKNKTGISQAAMSSTECTKLACGSTPHVNAYAKNRKTEDILCMEPPKFTDMNTHCFESQKSAPSIESVKKSDANNEMESLITPNENNTSKTQENAHSQKLPTNKDDFSSQNLQMDVISTKKTNINSLFRVKTISSKELARYLSHYNLTLKAVSIAGKTTNQVNEKSNEIQSTHTETRDDSQLISISADTNTKRSAFAVNNKHRLANNNPLATIALSCVGDTVFRTTRQGTFSNWKIGGTRCAKHFAYTKARASSYTERSESGRMKDRKKIHATTQYGTQFKHNRWKLSDTSCFQSQIKMFPLSNAFHDLAARDKATKQTLENSKIQNNLWPLSPTMHNLMNDSNPTETSGLQSDPMLTSAVPQDKNEDDFIAESDLELSRDSLSYPESMEKSNSNLNDFGSSQSQSDGFTTKSADESSDLCPSSFYDFSDIGDKIPDVNLKPGVHISHGPESNDLQSAFLTKLENNGTSSDGVASNAKCDVLKIKACRNTSSETTSYLHCYTDECVNSANQCTSETKNTKTENLKISDYSGNLVLDDIKKPVEDLNSKEADLESKRLGIDRTLRSLPLNKLRKQFGDDSLARHLYQKIQKLAADKRTTTKARNKSNKDMYRRTGQCAFLSPPVVPVTSAEQLEESVNFEDLLGFDNISGSLEFTNDYGGNESMLCTFESECQQPPASHQLACYSSGVSWSHFNSPGNRKNSHAQQEDENLHQEPLRSPPPLLSFAGNCYTTDHAHNIYGEEMIVTTHCHQNSSPSPSSIPTANNRPVSPSTFYNLPPVTSTPVFTETNMRSDNSGVTPCLNIHAARSPVVACIREPTMSDTDSGIHSPDSTPNKYVNASAATFTVETRPHFNGQDNSNGYLCAEAGARQEFLWMGENENFVSTNFENKMGNKLYLTAEESTATLLSSNNIESNQESWESCSTLSNSSSLSVGESQTKLFNMDDCKTYIANGPLHSSYSKKYVLKEEANLFNSTMNRPVFVSVSENNTANMSATKAPQRMAQESSKKRPVVFTNGNITTLYPSFVPHNRNSSAVSRDDNASRFQKRTESSALKTYNATIKSRIKREHFSQIGSGRSHGQRQTSDDSDDTLIDSFDIKIRRSSAGKSAHLWEFIRDTLLNPLYCPRLIKWENREAGIFRFVQSDVVAGMWGEKKNNPKMTYEKLSRAMRYYYNREILERVDGRRLVYKFGKNAYGWRLSEKTQEKNTKKGSLFEEELHPQGGQTLSRNLSSNCKNAEKSTDDNLHSPVKRRRVSSKDDEALSSTKEQSTGPLKTPATTVGLNANIAKECVRLTGVKRKSRDDNHQTEKSNTTSTVKKQQKTPRSSCIVYLARPTRLSDFTENGSENNVFKAQVGEWPSEERSVTPSSSLQSKLPSAEVLLGKQYKIATVA